MSEEADLDWNETRFLLINTIYPDFAVLYNRSNAVHNYRFVKYDSKIVGNQECQSPSNISFDVNLFSTPNVPDSHRFS
jgi:hypothetical protein